jgi:hypothetical protein
MNPDSSDFAVFLTVIRFVLILRNVPQSRYRTNVRTQACQVFEFSTGLAIG